MEAKARRNNIMVLRGSDREWMQEACENGLLSAEADRRSLRIMQEDEALRRENAYLRGIIKSQGATIRSFQQADLEAKRYAFERREGHRMGRGFRWIVGSSCAALGILTLFAIYNLAALWWM